MKKAIALLLSVIMVLGTAACGSKEESKAEKEPETVGEFLLEDFKANAKGTAQEIAEKVVANEILPFEAITMPVEPGLLSGFDNAEITGFKEGITFAPMIGTIPFIGYVFVLEDDVDVDTFKTTLKENANLRWNICTEAEELTVESEGNTVFFLMSPERFEEVSE